MVKEGGVVKGVRPGSGDESCATLACAGAAWGQEGKGGSGQGKEG